MLGKIKNFQSTSRNELLRRCSIRFNVILLALLFILAPQISFSESVRGLQASIHFFVNHKKYPRLGRMINYEFFNGREVTRTESDTEEWVKESKSVNHLQYLWTVYNTLMRDFPNLPAAMIVEMLRDLDQNGLHLDTQVTRLQLEIHYRLTEPEMPGAVEIHFKTFVAGKVELDVFETVSAETLIDQTRKNSQATQWPSRALLELTVQSARRSVISSLCALPQYKSLNLCWVR